MYIHMCVTAIVDSGIYIYIYIYIYMCVTAIVVSGNGG